MDLLRYTDNEENEEIVAYRMADGSVLSNANQLRVAVKKAWGRKTHNYDGQRQECQIWLEKYGAVPMPFTIFREVPGADVRDFSWVVKPVPEEDLEIVIPPQYYDGSPRTTYRHFSGACVFKIKSFTITGDID